MMGAAACQMPAMGYSSEVWAVACSKGAAPKNKRAATQAAKCLVFFIILKVKVRHKVRTFSSKRKKMPPENVAFLSAWVILSFLRPAGVRKKHCRFFQKHAVLFRKSGSAFIRLMQAFPPAAERLRDRCGYTDMPEGCHPVSEAAGRWGERCSTESAATHSKRAAITPPALRTHAGNSCLGL